MLKIRNREFLLFIIIVILIIALSLTTPFLFQVNESGKRVLDISSFLLHLDNHGYAYIEVIGMALVIISGQIDLSVGAQLACLGVLSAWCSLYLPVPLTILITIATGAVIGFINGFIVSRGRIHPFIVTLGMTTILRGIVVSYVQKEWMYVGDPYQAWGTSRILGVTVTTWLAILMVIIALFWIKNFRLARQVYSVGSNPTAARLTGINVDFVHFFTLFINGVLMGIAAISYTPRFNSIQNNIGGGFELFAISAVVIGGASIFGGKGSIIGSVLGVLLISLIRSAMVYFHVPGEWEQAVYGIALLITVAIDSLRTQAISDKA